MLSAPTGPRPAMPHRPVALVAMLVAAALTAVACSSGGEGPRLVADGEATGPGAGASTPPTSTAAPAPPTTADDGLTHEVATSLVEGAQPIYDSPDGSVARTLPNPWIGTQSLVLLVKQTVDDEWLEVYLPVRPNGSTGFVPVRDVEVSRHRWRIEVNLSAFRLEVFDGNQPFLGADIAVAADNTPTPGGLYFTTELLQPPTRTAPTAPSPTGCRASRTRWSPSTADRASSASTAPISRS